MKILLILVTLISLIHAEKLETSKTVCIQVAAYPGKTLAEQKKILVEKAKQESLEELYGTLISASTDIKNGKMTNEQIKSRAVGAVRVKGNPSFYNGKNLGEVCADVNVYITKKDLELYRPKKVSLTHFCFTDRSVALKNLKQQAKYAAYKEIISRYKASLKMNGKTAEKYIHQFIVSNDNFDLDTASYCFNAVATILPYELEMLTGSEQKMKNGEKSKPTIEKRVFTNPTTKDGYPVDRCYTWAHNCDKPVADKICRDNGYDYSINSSWEYKHPTKLLTGKICNASYCGAITYIECVREKASH